MSCSGRARWGPAQSSPSRVPPRQSQEGHLRRFEPAEKAHASSEENACIHIIHNEEYLQGAKRRKEEEEEEEKKKKRLRATPRLDPMRQLHAEDRRIASFVKDDPVVGLCDIPEDWDFDTYLMLTIEIRSKEKKEKKKKKKKKKKKGVGRVRQRTLHTHITYICRDTLHM